MKTFDTINQQVRETCRACHNVCLVDADEGGVARPVPAEGFRCEGCEKAGYERYDFDKSLPRPEPPLDATPSESASVQDTGTPSIASSIAAPGTPEGDAPAPEPASEARPSDEPKSGEVVQVT